MRISISKICVGLALLCMEYAAQEFGSLLFQRPLGGDACQQLVVHLPLILPFALLKKRSADIRIKTKSVVATTTDTAASPGSG